MKNWLRALGAFTFSFAIAAGAFAQSYPNKPIRLIIGFSAGGATDSIGRLYAQKLSELLQQPVIVDNRPGANQIAAIRLLQSSPADGYNLYLGTGSSLAQGPGMRRDLPYDPLKDFTLIGMVATTPGAIVVHPGLPVSNIRELIAYSKTHPDAINYGSAGMGTANHLHTEYLMSAVGTRWTHIPFKSDADVVREVSENRIQLSISTTQTTIPLIKAGRLKVLAVTTNKPLKYLPGVPTLQETGVKGMDGLEPYTFYGLVGPMGMPADVVSRLNGALNQISSMPDVALRMSETFFSEVAMGSPASFRDFMDKEVAKWREVSKTVKLPE